MARDTPGPPAVTADGSQPSPGKPRRLLFVTLPGCWGALIFACLSFTPSLLPRGGIVQGLVWGITAAIGYGLGVVAAWVWRAFADRDPRRPRRWAWRTFFITGGVLLVVAFALGQYWQDEIRNLMGVTDYNIPLVVASPFVAALITIDPEAFEGWKQRNGKDANATVADLTTDPDLMAEVELAIKDANQVVSKAEAIRKFRILPVDFTEDTGELTPTMKVKRNVVAEKFASDIEAIYTKD